MDSAQTNPGRHIQPATTQQRQRDLEAELASAQEQLRAAEAELAEEQAAVNAFRMHARLMLDDLVDDILALLAAKQSALTRLQLLQQDIDLAALDDDIPLDPRADHTPPDEGPDPVEALLPTDVPRDKAAERRLYRELARKFHPDLAESAVESAYRTSMMAAVNTAYAAGDLGALYDLAGELDPDEIARLSAIEEIELRRLQERITRCRRRRRKVGRQLQALRQESTARLWRKAQELEDGDNWWASVRRDLEAARERLRAEVSELERQIDSLTPVDLPGAET